MPGFIFLALYLLKNLVFEQSIIRLDILKKTFSIDQG